MGEFMSMVSTQFLFCCGNIFGGDWSTVSKSLIRQWKLFALKNFEEMKVLS